MHYRAKHDGDCNVPLKYVDYPSFGSFVNQQRREYHRFIKVKGSSLMQSKFRQLDQINFVWSLRSGGHESWETRLLDLQAYHRAHGHWVCVMSKVWWFAQQQQGEKEGRLGMAGGGGVKEQLMMTQKWFLQHLLLSVSSFSSMHKDND